MRRRNLYLASMVWVFTVAPATLADEAVHWGYSGAVGPDKWATLAPAFRACAEGRNQSPIDLTNLVEAELEPIAFAYKPGSKEILHNGHTIQVNYETGSTITISKHTFELTQFHFHSPSENTIDGKSFPIEGHLVHKDKSGNLAVVAVLFTEGASNPVLAELWKSLPTKAGVENALAAPVDASSLLPTDRDYYRFNGSLTTPPCSEGVWWMVMKGSVPASKDQIARLKDALGFANNRPVQPIYARQVLK